jgi:VWFA-related protein
MHSFSKAIGFSACKLLLLAAASAACYAAAAGQSSSANANGAATQAGTNQAAAGNQPVFHAQSNLVLVDVVVTDHDKAVHGLDRSAFHILQDGKEQSLASFDEHGTNIEPPAFMPATLPPNTYTNLPAYPVSSASNVILLDGLNTPINDRAQVHRKLIQYLETVKPGTTLAIFSLSLNLRMVVPFTTDVPRLVTALKNPKAQPVVQGFPSTAQDAASNNEATANEQSTPAPPLQSPISTASAPGVNLETAPGASYGTPINAAGALQQFDADAASFATDVRVKLTLDALQQLAQYLGGIDGRKNVVWISGAFPLVIFPSNSLKLPFDAMRIYTDKIRQTAEMLTAARVAIYPVDASGLGGPSMASAANKFVSPNEAYGASLAAEHEERDATIGAMQEMADDTGGQAYVQTNDLDRAMANAVDNGSSYYTIAYVPASTALDGAYHKIQVRIDAGHGYKLAYRHGYYADAASRSAPDTADQAKLLDAAIAYDAPPATQILFKARVLPANDPSFQGVNLPTGPGGQMSGPLTGATERYIIDLTLDTHGLAFDTLPDGSHSDPIEFSIVAYDKNGARVNAYDQRFQLGLQEAQYQRLLNSGISMRLPFDLPAGQSDLRIAVFDLNANRAGSLEVPLEVTP